MTEYDNSNKGAAFAPKEEQTLILTGSVQDDKQNKNRIAIVKDTDHQGKDVLSVYERVGVLYQNESDTGGAPDYSGPYKQNLRMAGWRNVSESAGNYLSLKISEKQNSQQQATPTPQVDNELADSAPF
jgi:uncharacterized protein (DUF736 family)